MKLIRLENVKKIYQTGDIELAALKGINLEIEQEEFVAIMGASGSGKSTAMNILGCLDKPTQGSYFLDGQDVSQLSKDELADIRNRKIGFVFQGFNLLPRTSALENVELPMLYLGIKSAERLKRSKEALALVGLEGKEKSYVNQLSGGQQQRVAIARALVNNPTIILADEPTGNLDSRTSIEVMGVFQYLNQVKGITLVLVTHEPDIAAYTKRIIVFKDGQIKEDRRVVTPESAQQTLAKLASQPDSPHQELA